MNDYNNDSMTQEQSDAFLQHVLRVMSLASIGNLAVRVQIPPNLDEDSLGYQLAAGLNVLLSDLEDQQRNRVRKLAEEAIAKSEEVRMVVKETQALMNEIRANTNKKDDPS